LIVKPRQISIIVFSVVESERTILKRDFPLHLFIPDPGSIGYGGQHWCQLMRKVAAVHVKVLTFICPKGKSNSAANINLINFCIYQKGQ